MTPQDVAALTALIGIVKVIGAWPLITLFVFMSAGPWIGLWWFTRITEKRHSAVVTMYSDNVSLVKSFDKLANSLQDIVILNTQVMQGMKESVDKNIYCPLMRKDPKVEKTVEKPS
ncbi:MAG: hypothetical protein PHY09_16795 [Desulfuromonadaceae bacterium]|nr:hypothetical protein [Desulfuromonadaceae bacterium]MDD5107573.1 hypothetical protein [Desulfuromonadaceae bacterium]